MLGFRTIFHPTDFSESAMYAFGLARAIAKTSGAELMIVHVMPAEQYRSRRRRREMYEALRRLANVDKDVSMRPLLLVGDVVSNIVSSANELDCELIVMGKSGGAGLVRLLRGSVSAAVQKQTRCPVAAVQLPNRVDWELPDFADEKTITAHHASAPSNGLVRVARESIEAENSAAPVVASGGRNRDIPWERT